MSQELWDLLKIGGVSSVDFLVGGLTGFLVDYLYSDVGGPLTQITDSKQFWNVFLTTFFEIFFDGILAVCLRKLVYPLDMEDLTGGMFFIMPFLMSQVGLFRRVRMIFDYFMGITFVPKNSGKIQESVFDGNQDESDF